MSRYNQAHTVSPAGASSLQLKLETLHRIARWGLNLNSQPSAASPEGTARFRSKLHTVRNIARWSFDLPIRTLHRTQRLQNRRRAFGLNPIPYTASLGGTKTFSHKSYIIHRKAAGRLRSQLYTVSSSGGRSVDSPVQSHHTHLPQKERDAFSRNFKPYTASAGGAQTFR